MQKSPVLIRLSLLIFTVFIKFSSFVHSEKSSILNLLENMLTDDFLTDCEIVYVHVHPNPATVGKGKNQTTLLGMAEQILPYSESWKSSGTFSIVRSAKTWHQIPKFRRLDDIHRYSIRHCGVAMLNIPVVTPDLPKWLFDSLTPRYVPILRKDEDHFIFVFDNEKNAQELLISDDFGRKIRYKIAVLSPKSESEKDKPVIQSVDLYGNAGEPLITPIEMDGTGVASLFPDSTRNFHGRKVRVASPKAPSHFEMKPLPGGKGYYPVRGIYVAWLNVMMQRFNFTIELFFSSYFGGTGKLLKNGTWVGAVGDVLSGRADIASFNGHVYQRHTVVEWSAPVTYEWMSFITHKPKINFSASAIFKPFPIILWVGFLASILALCLTIKFLLKLNPGFKYSMSYSKTLMYLFSSFLEQDSHYYMCIIHLSPIRAIIVFWLLFAMILSTAYRGKLVSLIAFPTFSWVPRNFEELAHSHYRVGLNTLGKGGAVYSVLSTSDNPVYQQIFERLEINPDSVKCLAEALHHDFGCIMVKSIGDIVAFKNFTDKFGRSPFQVSDHMALFHADGYIWEKKAVFRQNFDRLTWFIMETGLHGFWFQSDLDSLKQKRLAWEKETGNVTFIASFEEGPSKLKLAHLTGLFWLFIVGLVLGCAGLIVERFRPRHHDNKLDATMFAISISKVLVANMKPSSSTGVKSIETKRDDKFLFEMRYTKA